MRKLAIRDLDGDLAKIFGIELEPIETVPRALNSLIMALGRSPERDARVLKEALERLEGVSGPLKNYSASALLRGFEIIGANSCGKTAKKLGMMASALRTFVPDNADDQEVISLWTAVIKLAQGQRGREWSNTTSAWIQGLRTLQQCLGQTGDQAICQAI